MNIRPIVLLEVFLLTMSTLAAFGAKPTPEEMTLAQRWAAAKWEGKADRTDLQPAVMVIENHDPVQVNARAGRPLNLAGTQYRRGLYCHAPSRLAVRLPGPAHSFQATIGVDSNEQTSGGRGSVVFSVEVGGREVFRSRVLREGMAPLPVSVHLGGATAFSLVIEDAGDGISCDQSDWAEARVTLADNRTLYLDELPLVEGKTPGPIPSEPPFSFTYGGKSSGDFLAGWQRRHSKRRLGDTRTEHTTTYTDPATGLVVRAVAVTYADYPTVEWTLYLKNEGKADTPLITDLLPLDSRFERAGGEFVLHHHRGSECVAADFEPFADTLEPGADRRITTSGGRSSNSDFPYFNLEWQGQGVIAVIGWPGQWAAQFTRDQENGLRVRAGQELTHFVLHPGEQVRTPLIVLQFWQGDRLHAQNVWRQFMLAHVFPHPEGKPTPLHLAACSSHFYGEMIHANTDNQKFFIDRYLEERLPLDYWWMDAGWYVNSGDWPNTGTWEVDEKRFPGGLRPISDHAHAKGVRILVWFEPERVTPGTWLYEHKDWLLGRDGEQKLLNLGHPEARRWVVEHIDKMLREQGIDFFRSDFNIDPLPFWRANDAEDRQGITEIRYVEGFLWYWDELRRRHPGMLIDTCASGGRRMDLETLRRSVPLLRSDYILEPVGQQAHTYGIASWVPYYGTGINSPDPYVYRSQMCPYLNACYDMRKGPEYDWEAVRQAIGEWQRLRPYYAGDYYPLTPYSLMQDQWMAWQFHRADLGEGCVQAFRRADSVYEAARLPLRGLDADRRYQVENLNRPGETDILTGKELMESGVPVGIATKPGAVTLVYRAAP